MANEKKCDSLESRSSSPPHCGGLLSHADRRRRTAINTAKTIHVIPTDNLSFAMPILTSFGGMTQHIAVRQNCAGRSLCPAEARNSHSLVRGLRRLQPEPRHITSTANLPFAIPILALRLGGMTRVCAMRETAPLCGVIFGGSRKARPPPQPPKINLTSNPPNHPRQKNIRRPFERRIP